MRAVADGCLQSSLACLISAKIVAVLSESVIPGVQLTLFFLGGGLIYRLISVDCFTLGRTRSADVPEFEVIVSQPEYAVQPGEDAHLECSARSHIEVEAIEWTKYGDNLPPGELLFSYPVNPRTMFG